MSVENTPNKVCPINIFRCLDVDKLFELVLQLQDGTIPSVVYKRLTLSMIVKILIKIQDFEDLLYQKIF